MRRTSKLIYLIFSRVVLFPSSHYFTSWAFRRSAASFAIADSPRVLGNGARPSLSLSRRPSSLRHWLPLFYRLILLLSLFSSRSPLPTRAFFPDTEQCRDALFVVCSKALARSPAARLDQRQSSYFAEAVRVAFCLDARVLSSSQASPLMTAWALALTHQPPSTHKYGDGDRKR